MCMEHGDGSYALFFGAKEPSLGITPIKGIAKRECRDDEGCDDHEGEHDEKRDNVPLRSHWIPFVVCILEDVKEDSENKKCKDKVDQPLHPLAHKMYPLTNA